MLLTLLEPARVSESGKALSVATAEVIERLWREVESPAPEPPTETHRPSVPAERSVRQRVEYAND